MNYEEVIINEHYTKPDEIAEILRKPGKLSMRDLRKICDYFDISLKDLIIKAKKYHQRVKSVRAEYCERITIPLINDEIIEESPKRPIKPRKRKNSKKRSFGKRKISYKRIKKIANKKKISKSDLRSLAKYYNAPIKQGINGVWFGAVKKGHLQTMKSLYKNGHIKDTNITNSDGTTADEIAERKKHKRIVDWLDKESTQKVKIGKGSDYKFRQTYSDSEDTDVSISSED